MFPLPLAIPEMGYIANKVLIRERYETYISLEVFDHELQQNVCSVSIYIFATYTVREKEYIIWVFSLLYCVCK